MCINKHKRPLNRSITIGFVLFLIILSAASFIGHSRGQRDVNALEFEASEFKVDNEIKSLSDLITRMTKDMQ